MSLAARPLLLAIALTALAACDTTVTPVYQTSPENTIALQGIAAAGERASVAGVTAASGVDVTPTCRLLGALDIGGGQTPQQALLGALQAELLAGGAHAANCTPVSVTLTELKVDSLSGYWTIAGTVTTPKLPAGYSVRTRYDYKTSFTAYSACNNSAIAFNRAAARFINDMITHPDFRRAI